VTDSVYQAMFLTTREGVVLVDAPPTIGHNLLRPPTQASKRSRCSRAIDARNEGWGGATLIVDDYTFKPTIQGRRDRYGFWRHRPRARIHGI
jgi:hypothetical protein